MSLCQLTLSANPKNIRKHQSLWDLLEMFFAVKYECLVDMIHFLKMKLKHKHLQSVPIFKKGTKRHPLLLLVMYNSQKFNLTSSGILLLMGSTSYFSYSTCCFFFSLCDNGHLSYFVLFCITELSICLLAVISPLVIQSVNRFTLKITKM